MVSKRGVPYWWVLITIVVAPAAASAEGFRYLDRGGRSHVVSVTRSTFVSQAFSARKAAPAEPKPAAPMAPLSVPVGAGAVLPVAYQSVDGDPRNIAYFEHIRDAAMTYQLPVELVLAVIKVESNFNALAVSSKGAQGLMQLMPATAASLGVTDAFEPRQNVLGGAMFLRWLINSFDGDVSLALAAYNAGPGAVRRAGGVPNVPETLAYVPTVLAVYHAYRDSGVGRAMEGSRETIVDARAARHTSL